MTTAALQTVLTVPERYRGPVGLANGGWIAGTMAEALNGGRSAVEVTLHAPTPLEILPEIVDAVTGRAEIVLDGGIRRGSDAVKAIALGAKAVMVGRPYLYGLATDGQPGVDQALDILKTEIERTLALIGVPNLAELDRSAVRQPMRDVD